MAQLSGTFFGVIDWKISVVPRKASMVVSGEETPAVTLRGPFGYVGMGAMSFVADGMNEKGLIISVQTLYRSEYQHCNPLSKERPGQLMAVFCLLRNDFLPHEGKPGECTSVTGF